MIYKNCGRTTKTYYGVEFKPGEEKEVSKPIKDVNFFRVFRQQKVKSVKKPSSKNVQKRTYTKRTDKPNINNEKVGEEPIKEEESKILPDSKVDKVEEKDLTSKEETKKNGEEKE